MKILFFLLLSLYASDVICLGKRSKKKEANFAKIQQQRERELKKQNEQMESLFQEIVIFYQKAKRQVHSEPPLHEDDFKKLIASYSNLGGDIERRDLDSNKTIMQFALDMALPTTVRLLLGLGAEVSNEDFCEIQDNINAYYYNGIIVAPIESLENIKIALVNRYPEWRYIAFSERSNCVQYYKSCVIL